MVKACASDWGDCKKGPPAAQDTVVVWKRVFDLLRASASWKLAATIFCRRGIVMTRLILLSFCAGVACAGDAYLPSSLAAWANEPEPSRVTHTSSAETVSRGRHNFTE